MNADPEHVAIILARSLILTGESSLTWQMCLDDFNEELARCSSEHERIEHARRVIQMYAERLAVQEVA